ncbi:carbon-nitrogen hydrolase family protein [Corynebacterium pseudotuberculosis]|uniref:carbon-nitrogen hydrolase family protein n=1 Tax=Corynebacterium pseudotuberculosis TaxID=1719 RepID=UPI0004D11B0E|nr:carbon-nitrogen hydrolase family protein [Corynebacterium pseudotuberculosis]AIG06106.1 Putative hydrolase [Corynebacterium pseudotuberculosis]AKJ56561.1 UPF0012 hydrolase [Corynebacterium pseudotuberculosis]ANH25537.1 UPF0012 hydrolase [Corynebacterium pseudotuberculosis]AUY06737.1 Amidohydrolase [Corynebacterium pseudotuberculosis]AUY55924.1 Amidohydrolase [Corynebacterium pseudotuberculosis]
MRIALAQISATGNKQENLRLIEDQTRYAAQRGGANLVVFPEASMQAFDTGRLDINAEDISGAFVGRIKELTDELGIGVAVGMFTPADTVDVEGKSINRVHNTLVVTLPGAENPIFYNKIHTYDAFGYHESHTVKAGEDVVIFSYGGITFGLSTCYDVRLPGQFRTLAQRGAEVILLPASWANGTGKKEQWQLLTAARALDATCFVVAVDQADSGVKGPTGIGFSRVIGPDGVCIAEAGAGPELLIADISTKDLSDVRSAIPVLLGVDEYANASLEPNNI